MEAERHLVLLSLCVRAREGGLEAKGTRVPVGVDVSDALPQAKKEDDQSRDDKAKDAWDDRVRHLYLSVCP